MIVCNPKNIEDTFEVQQNVQDMSYIYLNIPNKQDQTENQFNSISKPTSLQFSSLTLQDLPSTRMSHSKPYRNQFPLEHL